MVRLFETKFLALLVCFTTALTMTSLNLKYSDYVLVRRTTCWGVWFAATDNLLGTEESYGTLNDDYVDCNFGVQFDWRPYDEVMITTVDREIWVVTKKTEIARMSA